MTPELVLNAVRSAARQVFDLGVRHGRQGGKREEQAATAMQYAEQLVMPVVETAIEQAVENAFVDVVSMRGAP